VLIRHCVAISMDGRGRATDNVFIERLWRSVKYEEIYLKDHATGADVNEGLTWWFPVHNYLPHPPRSAQRDAERTNPRRLGQPAVCFRYNFE